MTENMGERTVTNWMLYELIRDFKADMSRRMDSLERRMDVLENRMGALENRMDSLEKRIDSLERRMDGVETKVGEIYVHRNELTVKFTRSWAFASLFMAMLASSMVLGFSKLF